MMTLASPAASHLPDSPSLPSEQTLQHYSQSPKITKKNNNTVTAGTATAPVRSLTISKPKAKKEGDLQIKFRPTIILVAKYSFTAESNNELSVTKGDILKLLDQPRDGWILVKYIDKLHSPGLIPAAYVDIAVNDQVHPITINWLHGVEHADIVKEHSYLNLQFNKVEAVFQTINNKAYPVSASISNFFLFNNRYWYRLDVNYSDKSKAHLCRYYQDFYNLHITLLDLVSRISESAKSEELKLPKLPEPLPTTTTLNHYEESEDTKEDAKTDKSFEQETAQVNMLLKRCNDLNVYINKLILNKYFQTSIELVEWLELGYKDLPGFIVEFITEEKEEGVADGEIASKILPGSIDVLKIYQERKLEKEQEAEALKKDREAEANEVDDADLPARTKSKNIYNNYQQASHIMAQASRQGSVKLGRANSKSISSSGTRNSDPQNSSPRVLLHGLADTTDYIDTSTNSASTSFSPIDEEQVAIYSPDTSRGSHSSKSSRKDSLKPVKESEIMSQPPFTGSQMSSPKNLKNGRNDTIVPSNPQSPHLQQKVQAAANPVTHSPTHQYSPRFGPLPKAQAQYTHESKFSPHDKPYHVPQSMPSKMSPMGVNTNVFPISGYAMTRQPSTNDNAKNAQVSVASNFPQSSSGSPSPTSANVLSSVSHQFIKCKILNPRDEVIALKLPKSQIKTIGDLKNFVKSKVFYNKLFIKLPNLNNFENIDVVRFNITEFLKFNDMVLLRIA
ncbi:hypothetical protein KGF57_003650 [Candida theae]|uniref:SH3 domain-containing protein n=1 Tax=Candida theae TaxID=1198502 RepID=A0AAD5FXP1_9ASCO|nr:uncharacterized protein KGF57_003650 [Candida theae]KAI5955518.1 hypothetical protein KGF57_003650 [Candida theae]